MNKDQKILLLLDFDGTLSPIVDDPHKAMLPPKTKRWLRTISKQKNFMVGIVTGRSLSDIQKRVGLKELIYAANHGLEIHARGRLLLNKGRKFCRPIAALERKLLQNLALVPGVIVEMKGASLSVHYRKVKSKFLQQQVMEQARRVLRGQLRKNSLQLTSGKMVLEVRPRQHWNKGKAALWILHNLAAGHLPVYVGDDVTDEDAFSVLRPLGITILVGKNRKTVAQYRMRAFSPNAMSRYLRACRVNRCK